MKKYSKHLIAAGLILVLGLLFLAGRVGANPLQGDSKDNLLFSGTLEARQTRIAPEVGARVVAVRVAKGASVKVGDVLVELDDSTIKTNLTQAESAVREAQANLDQVNEQARPGNLALAQAGVAQAQADLGAATTALDDAKRALDLKQDLITQQHVWEGRVAAAQGQLAQTQAAVASLKDQLEQAQRDQSAAGKYKLAALQRQQDAASATLAAAQADLDGSQKVLDLYKALVANPLELRAVVNAAEKQVQVAEAGLGVAQANLDLVRNPARPESVALAQARLSAAQANLALIQQQAKRFRIVSPMSGSVVDRSIEPGETTRPGVGILTLADTSDLQMTLYVPIRDLASVRVGQTANLRVPSIPSKLFSGKVTYVSPEAEFKPANLYNSQDRSELVFAVRVTVPNQNQELKAGLPADATLQ